MSGFAVIAVLLLVAIAKLGYFFLSVKHDRRQDWKNRVAAMRQAQGQGQGQGGSYEVLQHASASAQACSKVVVTGAGTYLGRAIVRELARRTGKGRLHVVAFDWRVELDPELDITVTQGSLESKAHLRQLLQGCSAVVHLSTSSQGSVGRSQGLEEQRVVPLHATQALVETCLDLEVPNLLYSSSVSSIIAAGVVEQQLQDDSPYPGAERYVSAAAQARAQAERLVQAANSHVLQTLVLRVGQLFGYGDQGLADAALGAGVTGQANDNTVPVIWVEDAARAHALALEQMLSEQTDSSRHVKWGTAINLACDPEDCPTFKELVGQASPEGVAPGLSVWGRPTTASRVAPWAIDLLSAWATGLQQLTSGKTGPAALSQQGVRMWYQQSTTVQIRGAWEQLCWRPTPWKEAVNQIIKQHQEGAERRAQRESKDRAGGVLLQRPGTRKRR